MVAPLAVATEAGAGGDGTGGGSQPVTVAVAAPITQISAPIWNLGCTHGHEPYHDAQVVATPARGEVLV